MPQGYPPKLLLFNILVELRNFAITCHPEKVFNLFQFMGMVFLHCNFLLSTTDLAMANSKPNSNRLDSPFHQCSKFERLSYPSLNEKSRLNNIESLFQKVMQGEPNQLENTKSIFSDLLKLTTKSPEFMRSLEATTFLTNEILNSKNLHQKSRIWEFWSKYSVSRNRAPESRQSRKICLTSSSKEFMAFKKELLKTLEHYFRSDRLFHAHLDTIQKINLSIFASGELNFFGATVSSGTGKEVRLCINPEESPPLLLSKMIHEATHASNETLQSNHRNLKQKLSEYRLIVKEQERRLDLLYRFEDHLKADSPVEIDHMIDLVEEKQLAEKQKILDEMKILSEGLNPFRQKQKNIGLEEYAKKLANWKDLDLKQRKIYQKVYKMSLELDKERFVDEHRAYAFELAAAWHLVKNYPKEFCSLWVPSFQLKQPVRFAQAYQKIESTLAKHQMGDFLVKHYVNTGSYIAEAIFSYNNGKKEIDPVIKQKGIKVAEKVLKSFLIDKHHPKLKN